MAHPVICVVALLFILGISHTNSSLILGNGQFRSVNEKTPTEKAAELNLVAIRHMKSNDFNAAANLLQDALKLDPRNVDSNQLLGTLILKSGKDKLKSLDYFEKAIAYSNGEDLTLFSNYIEALRVAKKLKEAHEIGMELINNGIMKPTAETCTFYLNLGIVERLITNYDVALQLLDVALQCDINLLNAWINTAEILTDMTLYAESEMLLKKALSYFPNESYLYFLLGSAVHHQQKLDQALQLYLHAEKLNPNWMVVKANIAAALQGLGRAAEALYYYEMVLPHLPKDAGIRNNYGALLGTMNRKEEEVYWLKEALQIEPDLEHALVNLAGYFQDEGLLDEARDYLSRAVNVSRTSSTLLKLRLSLMMSPIAISWNQMVVERNRMRNNILMLRQEILKTGEASFPKAHLDTSLDRIHFYVPYHGLNDRSLEELIVAAYGWHVHEIGHLASTLAKQPSFLQRFYTTDTTNQQQIQALLHPKSSSPFSSISLSPSSSPSNTALQYLQRKRIGFMSKFFGIFEPHGMLLDGVMKYLPRSQFYVVCMLVARSDGKPAAPSVVESCDEVHEISLSYQHAFDHIQQLALDILVFADLVSEPINHFLALQRLAPIQMAFWGNPITSGSQTIDYFISADIMEHPYRTRFLPMQDTYSEQVVLTEGQGIWYFQPIDPNIELQKVNLSQIIGPIKTYTRQDVHLSNDWFVYLLPQSVFKIHPLYDLVLAKILQANPNNHLLITGGRRPRWTKLYVQRLQYLFGPSLASRLHLIERVSSENFYNLLTLADVILHPFPFDGSRTSADALIVDVPYVTMPTEYLRGRMGFAFLRTMNLPELVATNIQEYIDIAVRLSYDRPFLETMRSKIRQRKSLIWEDMEVPYAWTRLMQRITGFPMDSYASFLQHCAQQDPSRHVVTEMQKSQQRQANQAAFDQTFAAQSWMLARDAKQRAYAPLETHITNAHQWPWLFETWKQAELHRKPVPDPFFQELLQRVERLTQVGILASDSLFYEKFSAFSGLPIPQDSTTGKSETINGTITTFAPRPTGPSISGKKKMPLKPPEAPAQTQSQGATAASAGNAKPSTTTAATSSSISTSTTTLKTAAGSTTKPEGMLSPEVIQWVTMFHTAIRQRQFAQAITLGQTVYPLYTTQLRSLLSAGTSLSQTQWVEEYASFLVEYGGVWYLSGNYTAGKEFCEQAVQITEQYAPMTGIRPSAMMYACVGMSSLYLPGQEETSVQYLVHSYNTLLARSNGDGVDKSNGKEGKTGLFSVTKESLESSLFTSLHQFKAHDMCLHLTKQILSTSLPASSFFVRYRPPAVTATTTGPLDFVEASLLVLSTITWSPEHRQVLTQHLETLFRTHSTAYRQQPHLQQQQPHDWWEEIRLVQAHFDHVLGSLVGCVQDHVQYSQTYLPVILDSIIQLIGQLQLQSTPPTQPFSSPSPPLVPLTTTKPRIVLITQYFQSPHPHIQATLNRALTKNLANPYFDEIIQLTETALPKEYFASYPYSATKLKQFVLGHRLTFADAFQFANDYYSSSSITSTAPVVVVLANADIYFDYSLGKLLSIPTARWQDTTTRTNRTSQPSPLFLALLKWVDQDQFLTLPFRIDSQDSWVFTPPISPQIIAQSHFALGLPRCDNRIAHIFATANYTVQNPAFDIHGIEIPVNAGLDGSQQGKGKGEGTGLYGMENAVEGAGQMVFIQDQLIA